jgi:hypothetical protein
MEQKRPRILKPQEYDALTPDEQRDYMRAIAKCVADENREALEMLAAHDRGEVPAVRSQP